MTNCSADTCTMHVGEVGKEIRLRFFDLDPDTGIETAVDLTPFTTRELLLLGPSDSLAAVKTLSLVGDGTDGLAKYVTEAGVIDEAGSWVAQGHLAGAGADFYSERVSFQVDAPLPTA